MSELICIRSERVVTPGGVGPAEVLISDGVIQAVGPEVELPEGRFLQLDAGDLAVLPGGVDVHTHMDMVVGGVHTADDWASESRLPLVFAGGVAAGRFDLATFVDRVSTGPARLAGLYPRKGVIAPGADADLVIWDLEGETSLDVEALHSQMDHSPYQGMRTAGRVVAVIRAGRVVVSNGEWAGDDAPPGRVLRRARVGGERS